MNNPGTFDIENIVFGDQGKLVVSDVANIQIDVAGQNIDSAMTTDQYQTKAIGCDNDYNDY